MDDFTNYTIPPTNFELTRNSLNNITTPIFVNHNGRVAAHATGLLFACGDKYFIVTARHAVIDSVEYKADLLIPSDYNIGKLVLLTGKFFFLNDARIDVAIYFVDEDFRKHFSKHQWTHIGDFVESFRGSPIYTACCGLLSKESDSWQENARNPDAQLMHTVVFSQLTELEALPPEWMSHIHIAAKANINYCTDNKNKPREYPKSLVGISGSPVIVFTANPCGSTFSPMPIRILGFQSAITSLNDGSGIQLQKIIHWRLMLHIVICLYPSLNDVTKHYGVRNFN